MTFLPDHYNLENIKRGAKNPKLLIDEIARGCNNVLFDRRYGHGVDVLEEDWDNLIILDACRYDTFAAQNDINGRLESRISAGSESRTFIAENFHNRTIHDTVYVTANAFASTIGDDVFHAIEPVELNSVQEYSGYEPPTGGDTLPDDSYAALPDDMVEQTREMMTRYPEKRLIVHFMQPHIPFIGPKGLDLYRRLLARNEELRPDGRRRRWGALGNKPYHFVDNPKYDITREEISTAYKENLNFVLDHVRELLADLDGRTIVTADHGEMLGEQLYPFGNRWYGHPSMLKTPELRKVPWFIPESSIDADRKEVTAEPPVETDRMDDEEVQEKLHALGYRS